MNEDNMWGKELSHAERRRQVKDQPETEVHGYREGRLMKLLKGKKGMWKSTQRDYTRQNQERKRKVLEGLRGDPHIYNLVCISA